MRLAEPLIWGAVWVLIGTLTAFLPIRAQRWPGVPLLIAAPVLLWWIGREHGLIWVGLGLMAILSMMRMPIRYLWAKARGREPDLPPEILQDLRRK